MSPRLPSAIPSRPRSRAFASAWVDALAGGALGDSKLAESRDRDLAAAPQRILDRVDDGVDRASGIGLGQRGAICDLLDKLRLLHVVLLCLIGKLTLTPHADGELATMRAWA